MNSESLALKTEILRLTRQFSSHAHSANLPSAQAILPFEPGKTMVPYAGRVFTADEVAAAVEATLDFWLTLGPEGEAFEQELAALLGVRYTLLVNSGSSANLVAIATLTSHKIPSNRRLRAGDEVITVAAGFPTTVAPIIQVGAVPVFIDNDPRTGNVCLQELDQAFSPGKTKAVVLAHALGNPFDIKNILEFCKKNELWLIEDNCDALGGTYSIPANEARALGFDKNSPGIPNDGEYITRYSGTWGDISTQSFYPPHHITMGEGGAVNIIKQSYLKGIAESFRDWGRDCWCASGKDNTCAKRFGWQLGELPKGYDHKYIYSHIGYNLKPLDPQAAIGRRQLKRLPEFVRARRENWEYLRCGLRHLTDFFDFTLPTHATAWLPPQGRTGGEDSGDLHAFSWDRSGCIANPSWFGFMVRVKATAPFTHTDLARYLDERKIGNRMFFGGNLLRQPAFVQLKREYPSAFRVVGRLNGADEIMHHALFLGCYPGLTRPMLDYVVDTVQAFVAQK